ncbi:MAG: choice-of-anchor L domain-containing protein [Bacteroidota bacterium]
MRTLFFIAGLFFLVQVNAQLTVTGGFNAQQLANILAGYNITVTNATVTGDAQQYGSFQFSGTGLNVNSGVILSTGKITDAVGPNDNGGTSTAFNGPGNSLLTALAGYQTHDAVVLQFDFEVQTDRIEFKYIFLSEEYNEWVGSGFNDVFAFYISGPGITGEENLAVVPSTTTPVSINTINSSSFWQFYVNNEAGGTNIEFDGFTTLMTAKKEGLIPCETYTLKLMIADGSDAIYDAGVLLQENSLVQTNISASVNTYSANNIALEGCIQASFTFQLDSAMQQNTPVPFGIGGTALNGVDYAYIDTLIIIPAGQTSATIIIDAYADGITEGQEYVELYFHTSTCGPVDTVTLYIDDADPIEFQISGIDLACAGDASGEVDVSITGGFAPYTITLTNTSTGTQTVHTTLPVTGLDASTYLVEISDSYGCNAEAVVIGGDFDAGTTFLPDGTGVSYTSPITISGFNAGQTITSASQINSICATMEHSYANDLTIVLEAPNGTQVTLKNAGPTGGSINACNLGEPVASGPVDSWNNSNTTPGIGYQYCWTNNPVYSTMNAIISPNPPGPPPQYTYTTQVGNTYTDYYLPPGSYTPIQNLAGFVGVPLNGVWSLIVTDNYALDNGYIFDWSISLTSDLPDSTITLNEPDEIVINGGVISPACGTADGQIDITPSGDYPPFAFLWSNSATTEDISGILAGTYTVTVTDNNGCTNDMTFLVGNASPITVTATVNEPACHGLDNGDIDIDITSGVSPYTVNWSNSATTEDITDLYAGTYTVTVTDDIGCVSIQNIIVGEPGAIVLTALLTNEECGDGEGSINLSVSGGTPPYLYLWSNSATTEDIDELAQGNFTVTVTDQNGCTASATYQIVNYVGNCIPNCDVEIIDQLVADETCGNTNGSIELTIFTSFSPYSVQWSNGSSTEDIYMLSSGTYTVTITDEEGCTLVHNFPVLNQSGNLDVISVVTADETCGNGTGSIDITVNGGAMPYVYAWSNSATTQDITGIHQGTYTVTVTDANNCSVYSGGTVNNIAGTLIQTYGNAVNEVCGNNMGSVDISISGGNIPYSYHWSSGPTSQDLVNIGSGSYTCTITDASGCSIYTPVYVVSNESGTLSIGSIDIDPEICGNAAGEIELFLSGGTPPLAFLWSGGQTTQNISNLQEGTYSCEITDNNGCSLNTGNLAIVNEPGTLELVSVEKTNETCGNGQGSVNITVTGGTTPYTYSWSNGSTSEDLLQVHAGTYSCTVTDANGCEITLNATLSNSTGTLSLQNTIITDETCGNGAGQVNLVLSGGTLPLAYSWNSGQTTEDITGLSTGTYTCTIMDANGCLITASAQVDNNTGTLALNNYSITNEICSDGQGAIDLTVSGTLTPISYSWNSGQTTQDLYGISAGSYTCTMTDNSGCSLIAGPYQINNSAPGLIVSIVSITPESCGNGNGAIDIAVSGGSGNFTYLWSNSATTQDISSLIAGTYSYTVTDLNGCSVSNNVVVVNNSGTLAISGSVVNNEICSNGNGSINITVAGGSTPYTYVWSNSSSSEDITGLSDGYFTVTVTDASGCSVTSSSYHVNNDPGSFALTSMGVVDESCGDGTGAIDITLAGGLNPITYQWSNGAFTVDISGLSAGVYACTATDNNNCELIYGGTVYNDAGNLNISDATVTNETCNESNGEIDLTIGGGTTPYNYLWSNGATTEDITAIDGGYYTCNVSDANGCSVSYGTTVANIGGNLLISNVVAADEYCGHTDGSVNITVTGGTGPYTYIWNSGSTTEDISMLSEGTYSVTVTDQNGCTAQGDATVTNNSSGTVSIDDITVTDEYCGDGQGQVDITYSGGNEPISIQWSNGMSDEDLEDISAGSYTVTITDATGCYTTGSALVVNETNGFVISDTTVTQENCGDGLGAIDLTLTGGITPYNFNWNIGASTEDLINLPAGTYTCTITDQAGCYFTITEIIENVTNGLEFVSSSSLDDYCYGYTGEADITVTGGITPYSFNWSNGATTEDLSGITAGTYDVTITDNTGCMIYNQVVVQNTVNSSLGFGSVSVTNDNCGQGNGMIVFTLASPGSYIYEINGVPSGSPLTQFTGLDEGFYTISIVDVGCHADTSVFVGNNAPFTVNIGNIIPDNCGNGTGGAAIGVNPSGGNYTFTWSNGTYLQNLYYVTGGTYTCEVSDDQGCHDMIIVDIPNNSSFSASTVVTDEFCGNANGNIDLTLTGATLPVTYSWNTGATTEDLMNIPAGNYTCTITDGNFCTVYISETLQNELGNMTVITSPVNDFCNMAQGYIGTDIIGGSGNFSVLWNTGSSADTLYDLTAGNYSVTVTDNTSGCVFTDDFILENDGYFTVSEVITHASCPTCNDGAIDLIISGASPNYYFNWSSGQSTEDINGIIGGTYTVTVSDDWGCSTVETYFVGSGNLLVNAIITNDTCNQFTGIIDLEVNGGSGAYSYAWNTGDTTEVLFDLPAGTYDVTVTDNIYGYSVLQSFIINSLGGAYSVSGNTVNSSCSTCSDGSIDLTVTGFGPYTFLWSTGATMEDITGLLPGLYTVTITDNFGCITVETYQVFDINTVLAATYTVNDDVCSQSLGSITLNVSGGSGTYYYGWNTGASTSAISGLSAGTYSVTVTDAMYFTSWTETFVVADNGGSITSSASVTNSTCSTCNDGVIDLTVTGSGPFTFLWNTSAITEDLTALLPGIYSVTITDGFGCTTEELFQVFDAATVISATYITGNDTCALGLGFIELSVTGGSGSYYYTWSTGASGSGLYGLNEGSYDVTVTDAVNFTTWTQTIMIANTGGNYTLNSYIVNSTCSTCNDGGVYITLSGAGPFTFNWSNGATTEDISGLLPGNYTVSVTDSYGCIFIETFQVFDMNTVISGTYDIGNDVCNSGTGYIEVFVTGGSGVYFYLWNTGADTTIITDLTAGTYIVTATDATYFTTYIDTFLITNTGGNTVVVPSVTNSSCSVCSDGAINLMVTGTGPFTYIWSTSDTGEDIFNLLPGVYTVTITDDTGCTSVETFEVFDSATVLSASYIIGNDTCSQSLGFIDVTVSGGSGSYSYAWNSGQTTASITGIPAGNYSVTVTDDTYLTTWIQTFTVGNLGGAYSLSGYVVNSSCASCNDGAINLTVSGPGLYSYSWTGGATSEDLSGLLPGMYSVTVTDSYGCTQEDIWQVFDVTTVLSATWNSGNDTCNAGLGYIELFVTGGSGTYSYLWDDNSTVSSLTGLTSGNYGVTVTDDVYGTTWEHIFLISNTGGLFTATAYVTNSSCATCFDGIINLVVSGTGPYIYAWSNSAITEDLTFIPPGIYCVTITDQWGCSLVYCDTVDYFVGMNIPVMANMLNAYPNPVSDLLKIEYQLDGAEKWIMQVYGPTGMLVYSSRFEKNEGFIEIDMSGMASGLYLIEVQNGHERIVKKVLKGR